MSKFKHYQIVEMMDLVECSEVSAGVLVVVVAEEKLGRKNLVEDPKAGEVAMLNLLETDLVG